MKKKEDNKEVSQYEKGDENINITDKIIAALEPIGEEFLLPNSLYNKYILESAEQKISNYMLEKVGRPVELWCLFRGNITLCHYTNEDNYNKIIKNGFNSLPSTFIDNRTKGVWALDAYGNRGVQASYWVNADYPENTYKVIFNYSGLYYRIINDRPEYIFITEEIPITDIVRM